ncbi:MAG: hypothetical protein LC122_13225 [Chitinophagales bacterium]|nr:hypothetical protein [Chitinophagales bacterium]
MNHFKSLINNIELFTKLAELEKTEQELIKYINYLELVVNNYKKFTQGISSNHPDFDLKLKRAQDYLLSDQNVRVFDYLTKHENDIPEDYREKFKTINFIFTSTKGFAQTLL